MPLLHSFHRAAGKAPTHAQASPPPCQLLVRSSRGSLQTGSREYLSVRLPFGRCPRHGGKCCRPLHTPCICPSSRVSTGSHHTQPAAKENKRGFPGASSSPQARVFPRKCYCALLGRFCGGCNELIQYQASVSIPAGTPWLFFQPCNYNPNFSTASSQSLTSHLPLMQTPW